MVANHLNTQEIIHYFEAKPRWFRFGLATLTVISAVILTLSIDAIAENSMFLLFFFTIIQSALWLGQREGLLAMLLSLAAINTFLLPPVWKGAPSDVLMLNACFCLLSVIVIVTTRSHRALSVRLWESRQDLNHAQAVAQTGSWRMDLLHNQLFWSDENYRIFGMPKGMPLTYDTFLAAIHPEDREYVNQKWQAALAGETYDIEHRVVVAGDVRWLRERAVLEFNQKGALQGGFGTTQDITERKQSELKLVEIEQQYAGIVNSAMDAIITTDSDQRILVFNAAAEKMFGCSADKAIGAPLKRFIPGRFHRSHDRLVNAFAHTGIASRKMGLIGNIFGMHTNGEEFPIEVSISQTVTNGKTTYTAILRDITERSRSDAILKEQLKLQGQLAKIAATVPGVICSFRVRPDGTSHMPYASQAFESVSGLSREVVAKDFSPFFECIHLRDLDQVNATTAKSARTLQPWFGEFRYHHPTKGEIWLESHSMPEREIDGSILWHGYIQDITQRKLAELKLKESIARYELVLEGAQDAIWDWDVPKKRVNFSPRWKSLRGYSENEIGDDETEWSASIHPDDTARVLAAVQAHFDGKTPVFSEEYRIRCRDGAWKWILDRGIAQKDNAGNVIRMAGSENDITKRKEAEAALRNRESELRLIMDATPALIAYLDSDFHYLRINKAYENWFCIPIKSILGKEAREIIGERAWEIVQPYLERAKAGEHVSFDYQIPYGTGKPRWVLGNYIPDKDVDGNVKGIVVHVMDIEDRKQAEQQIATLNQNLQHRIEEMQVIFDTVPIGLSIADDATGLHIRGNPANEQMLGLPPGSELSKKGESSASYRLILDGKELAIDELPMQRAIQGETVINQIVDMLRPDGQLVTLLCNANPLFNEQGLPRGAVGAFQDISPLKQAELTLRENAERMQLATKATGVGIWEWHIGSNRIRWDTQMFQIYGIAPTSDGFIDYSTWSRAVLLEDLPLQEQILQTTVRNLGQSAREFRIVRADDHELRIIQAVDTTRINAQGQAEWIVGTNLDITAQKQAALALQASEARLALGVQVAGLALAEVDYTTGLNYLSAEAARLFGLGESAMVLPRETVHASFHPDDRNELMHLITESLAPSGKGWFAMDHRVQLPGGLVRWLRVRKQVWFEGENSHRRPLRATIAIHDITAEKNATEALQISETFVRNVLNSLPEHVVVLNEQGEVTSVNEPWLRFASANGGTPKAVSIGANYLEVCRNSSAAGDPFAHQALTGLEDLFAGHQQEFVMEYPCQTTNRMLWFLLHAKRLFHSPNGIILTHVDITDRKGAEEELRNTQARLNLVVEELKVGYWDWDLVGRSIFVSPEWKYQLGIDENEPLNDLDEWQCRLHPDDQAFFLNVTDDYIAGKQPIYELDYRLRHQDGSYRWIHSRGVLLRDPNNTPYRLLGLNLDITDYKLSNELNTRRNRMEQTFRLYVASQTAAAIAHELNQPLTAISYYADVAKELLETGNPNPLKLSEIMGKCGQQALRAGGVIRELMTLLHKGESITELMDINIAVLEAVNFVKSDGLLEGFKIEQNLATHLPLVKANHLQVQKILINLLHNSLESMREGSGNAGTISLSTHIAADNPTMAQVSVSDSGKGVADSVMLKTIFQPFYTTKPNGLGMGLAISRSLIEAHNGKMWAEQNAGPGITIHFTLTFEI